MPDPLRTVPSLFVVFVTFAAMVSILAALRTPVPDPAEMDAFLDGLCYTPAAGWTLDRAPGETLQSVAPAYSELRPDALSLLVVTDRRFVAVAHPATPYDLLSRLRQADVAISAVEAVRTRQVERGAGVRLEAVGPDGEMLWGGTLCGTTTDARAFTERVRTVMTGSP